MTEKKFLKQKSISTLLVVVLAVLWISYLTRSLLLNEWGMEFGILLGRRVWELLEFGSVIFVSGLVGIKVTRLFLPRISYALCCAYGVGLGLGFLALYIFFCGRLGFLRMETVIYFFLFSSLVGFKEALLFIRKTKEKWIRIRLIENADLTTWILRGVVILSGIMLLTGAYSPILDYDSLEYHVGIPDLYLKAGKIFPISSNMFSHFPMNVEMLYLVFLLLGKVGFIKLLNVFFAGLSGFLIYQFTGPIWGKKSALLSLALFLCSIHLAGVAWLGKSDLGLVYFSLAALLLFLEANSRNRMLSGIFAGLALGSKTTALIYVWACLFLVGGFQFIREKKKGKILLSGLLFLIFSLLVVSPWWLKNWIETGDPIFPFGYPLFQNHFWPLELYQRLKVHYGTLSLTHQTNLANSFTWMIQHADDFIPTAYIGLPLIFLSLKEPKLLALFIYVSAGYILGFLKTTGDSRFLLPVFPALSILAGVSFTQFRSSVPLRRIMACAFSIFMIWNLGFMTLYLEGLGAERSLFSLESTPKYLRHRLPPYRAVEFLNRAMKPGEKVLLVGEARVFYLKRDVLASTPFDVPVIVQYLEGAKNSGEIYQRLRSDGISYILIHQNEMRRLDHSFPHWSDRIDGRKLNLFLRDYSKPVFHQEKGGIDIYKIIKP
ncbi:MAG: glycosyltransferase family 39 protein [Chlamydiae bacterium]|nr:glycosyltransferase family 39 protein [Chlamydiota bacterium]MBI3277298.1 glycosyltransferase family 39 protein [Chlamydiota bacterium]